MIRWLLKIFYKKEIETMWQIVQNKDNQIKNLQNQIISMQGKTIKQPKERIYLR